VANQLSTTLNNTTKSITIEQVRNFFNEYIKTYYPYRDEVVYSTLISNLTEYYYNNMYNVIPQELKEFIEQHNIDNVVLYDRLLVSIGVPDTLIRDLTYDEKAIFLKNLGNFYQYKSTLNFVQNLGEVYSETNIVNIYELYIDYDSSLSQPWVLKPVNIFHNDQVDLNENSLDYVDAYDKIPSLLIETTRLDAMKTAGEIVLPLKSNILFLDYNLNLEVNSLQFLIVTTFLKEYKSDFIEVYFSDGSSLNCRLGSICFAWFYLISQYYSYNWPAIGQVPTYIPIILTMSYDSISFPYSIGDINQLITDYNNISTIAERDDYYRDNFSQYFLTQTTFQSVTLLQMQGMLRSLDKNLGSYLDSLIDASPSNIEGLLTNIYNSLIVYNDNLASSDFKKYFSYFLSFLPQILEDPSKTATYKILQEFKPYHVELYSRFQESIHCDDKFNSAWVETYDYNFRLIKFLANIFNASDIATHSTVYTYSDTVTPASIEDRYQIIGGSDIEP